MSMAWVVSLCALVLLVILYVRAVLIRSANFRRRASVMPDYIRIRQLENELGLDPTPFPSHLPSIRMPTEMAAKFGRADVNISWADAAEMLFSGAFDEYLKLDERVSLPASPQSR